MASKLGDFEVLTEQNMGSDHSPIIIQPCQKEHNVHTIQAEPKFDFVRADWKKFADNLPVEFPDDVLSIESRNEFITSSILKAAEAAIPNKKPKRRGKRLPESIIELIKARQILRRVAETTQAQADKAKYNKLSQVVKDEIIAVNNENWNTFIDGLNKFSLSSRPFWHRISVVKGGNSKKNDIPTLIESGRELKTDEEKANLFAERLKNTFCDSNHVRFDEKFRKKVKKEVSEARFEDSVDSSVEYFSINELILVIKLINNKCSPGKDKINNLFLKNASLEFKKLILKLFNQTIVENYIPSSWKASIITMIPKKVRTASAKGYRPISITSCLGKLCERLILLRLTEFFEDNKIIVPQQSGFRKHRQTKDNIFCLIQKIAESFNRKKRACGLFFDIEAAFDRVWHDGLLFKLNTLKTPIHLVNWVKNFLKGRTFSVKVGSFISDVCPITAGVPQGSVLSPLLFAIYINDIPKPDSRNRANSLLFADDLAALFVFRSIKSAQATMTKYLRNVEEWLSKWRLMMAPSKCHCVVFSRHTKTDDSNSFDLRLFGEKISNEKVTTFLGIRFDRRLNFDHQVKYIEETCLKRLNVLKVLANYRWKIKKEVLTKVYVLLIRSVIDYSSLVLSSLCKSRLLKLQRIQNSAIRTIFKLGKHTRTEDLHNTAKLEMIETRLARLNRAYFIRGWLLKNPIVVESTNEYLNFAGARVIVFKTPLCQLGKEEIKTLLDSLIPP
jgi:hypothetical protein